MEFDGKLDYKSDMNLLNLTYWNILALVLYIRKSDHVPRIYSK